MAETSQGTPAPGWRIIGGNPSDMAYFDGQRWTWRRQRLASGEWRQFLIPAPAAGSDPEAGRPGGALSPPTVDPGTGHTEAMPPPASGVQSTPPSPMPVYGVQSTPPPASGVQSTPPPPPASDVQSTPPPPMPVYGETTEPTRPSGPPGSTAPYGAPGSYGGPPFGPPPGAYGPPTGYIGGPGMPTATLGGVPPGGGWVSPDGRLDLLLSEPERQSRWTVLFRLILIVPNAFVLGILELCCVPVVVIMWFSALFTGRVPRGMWSFVTEVLRWSARTTSYSYLLTDKYPPFNGYDGAYPVAILFGGPPARLNRGSVLFRAVLLVPGYVVSAAFSTGLSLMAVLAWICTLVVGRPPRSLYLALAAGVRYQLRFFAYSCLLTPVYPWGVLGDGPRAPDRTLLEGTLVLKGAAKGFAIVALAVGSLYVAAIGVGDVSIIPNFGRTQVQQQLDAMSERARTAGLQYANAAEACGDDLNCVEAALPILARSLATQISTLRSIGFPTSATRSDATQIAAILEQQKVLVSAMEVVTSMATFSTDESKLVALTRQLEPLYLDLRERLAHVFPTA